LNKAKGKLWSFGRKVPQMVSRVTRPHDDSFWDGDHMTGKPLIRINLTEQRIYYYKGGQLAGISPISSGREGYGTTTGRFRISEKDIDHKSSWYGEYVDEYGDPVMRDIDVRKDRRPPGTKFDGANMRYFMRVNGPIGMHEGYLPGYPASHGCIRLPSHMAEAFYHATPLGTPVEVVR
jgi:lipoprotein-anchoring transpeptidase ErfK/SrfK